MSSVAWLMLGVVPISNPDLRRLLRATASKYHGLRDVHLGDFAQRLVDVDFVVRSDQAFAAFGNQAELPTIALPIARAFQFLPTCRSEHQW